MPTVIVPAGIVELSLVEERLFNHDVGRDLAIGLSLWRSHMNAVLSRLEMPGPVLDMGSGSMVVQSRCWQPPADILSVDLELARCPTAQADILGGVPFRSETFGACLALNLIEHLPDAVPLLTEAHRLLRPGGRLIVAVPFLHRVHRAPVDHARYTDTTLSDLLAACGFEGVRIAACGAGPFTAALAQLDFTVPRRLRAGSVRVTRGLDALTTRRSGGRYRNRWDYPLGYVAMGERRTAPL